MKTRLAVFALMVGFAGCASHPAAVERKPTFVGEYFWPADLDRQPVLKSKVAPTYPKKFGRHQPYVQVLVGLVVDAHGKPTQVQVSKAADAAYADAAIDAVNRWRFEPGSRGDRVVACAMLVPVEFGEDLPSKDGEPLVQ